MLERDREIQVDLRTLAHRVRTLEQFRGLHEVAAEVARGRGGVQRTPVARIGVGGFVVWRVNSRP
ncbi:MAG: hypothetical protein ACXW28_06355 [Thermoanaerobaculia bacterium]